MTLNPSAMPLAAALLVAVLTLACTRMGYAQDGISAEEARAIALAEVPGQVLQIETETATYEVETRYLRAAAVTASWATVRRMRLCVSDTSGGCHVPSRESRPVSVSKSTHAAR